MNELKKLLASFDDRYVRLTKTGSKRASRVGVGKIHKGQMSFVDYTGDELLPDQVDALNTFCCGTKWSKNWES